VKPQLTRLISARVRESVALQQKLLEPDRRALIARVADVVVEALRGGGKVILFGNGGSAADAQHIAAELVGRYVRERGALPAIALTTNSSVVTAVANDYSYDAVFVRQLEALCRAGDVAIALSTSGDSANVLAGVETARRLGATAVALTGATGGRLLDACDYCIRFPSYETPRVQEGHTLIGHILCELVEEELARERPSTGG
jgi:D-sedoheptulose 7-phosphate isomerase